MIPKVTYGTRVRGLLEYLWGPGKAEEHINPHLVAGYDDASLLTPGRHDRDGERWSLDELAARLDAPQIAAGERGVKQYVWQCSLSLPAQEGQLDDATWGRIAGRFVAEMGFTGSPDRAGCRWIAVRHGLSARGNDHVHLVVTLATEDGAPVWLRQDKRRSQQVAD
ncbi:relaxase/mobilization nuclease domain-containing protein, partial [Micromonospora sp. DT228]